MVGYITRRLLGMVLLLLVLTMAVFFLFNLLPSDPARLTCGKICTPALLEANRHKLGLDMPAKLLALAQFAEDHGDSFVRIWSIGTSTDGTLRYLDLQDLAVRDEVRAFTGGKVTALYGRRPIDAI